MSVRALNLAVLRQVQLKSTTVIIFIVLITMACSLNYGGFSSLGVMLLCLVLFGGLFLLPKRTYGLFSRATMCVAIIISSVLNLAPSLLDFSHNQGSGLVFIAIGLLGAMLILFTQGVFRWCGLFLAGGTVILRVLTGIQWGRSNIDVFYMLQGGAEDLLRGTNPYFTKFASTTAGTSFLHFTYGTGALLVSIPGRLLGDVRLSEIIIMALLLLSITMLARRHLGSQLSWWLLALMVTSPFIPYMIMKAWIEFVGVTGITTFLWLRGQYPKTSILILGLGISSSPLALPLLIIPYFKDLRMRFEITFGVIVAFLLAIPFIFWTGPGKYFHDILLVQFSLPWRHDALGLNAAWGEIMKAPLPLVASLGIPVLIFIYLFITWPKRLDVSVLVGSIFLLTVVMLAKFAFFNYYFIIVFGMFLSLALGCGFPKGRIEQEYNTTEDSSLSEASD